MAAKDDKDINQVQLRVDVPESFRARLKAQSARMGITMGELVVKLAEEGVTLRQLEEDALRGN